MSSDDLYFKRESFAQRAAANLETWGTSQTNREIMDRFIVHLQNKNCCNQRIAKLSTYMRRIADEAPANLDSMTRDDLNALLNRLRKLKRNDGKLYHQNTLRDFRKLIRQFYRWYEDEDPRLLSKDEDIRREAVQFYKGVKQTVVGQNTETLDPADMLSEQDIQRVISKGCRYTHERAVIRVLFETGCRAGELLGMRLKDIDKTKVTHWTIWINGKTGRRPLFIIDSIVYLGKWLEEHPDADNPGAYLWTSNNWRHRGKRLKYLGLRKLLNRCFKLANVAKPCNPHQFRHSRNTEDARTNQLSEDLRRKKMGWSRYSKMPQRYTHLVNEDLEEAYLQARGVKERPQDAPTVESKNCSCGEINIPEAKYCARCGKALDMKTVYAEDDYLRRALEAMSKVMADPNLREQFEAWKANRAKNGQSPAS